MKNTCFDLLSVRKKKKKKKENPHVVRSMKVSSRAMGSAVEYFMFSKWKGKILVCLCIFFIKILGKK